MTTPVVLITGALTGIGRAAALAFAKEGARLLVSGRKEAGGNALEAELRASGAEAEFMIADGRHETDVANLVDRAVRPARCRRQQCRYRGQAGPADRCVSRSVRRDVRHQCPRCSPQRETRDAGYAVAGQRQHRQHLINDGRTWSRQPRALYGKQARGRGHHEICCA
jgi:hypothetical protein